MVEKMKSISAHDLMIFSRIVGAALLVCGYLVAGLYVGRWCMARGYPGWTLPLSLIGGLVCALFAGWRELKSILASIRGGSR